MDNKRINQHISRKYNQELEDIRTKVLTMGGLVEQQIELAMKAFMIGDMEVADQVIQLDFQVNKLEKELDQECIQVMVRRQPTAIDLRLIISVIKTISDLERIGDQAERIAQSAIHLYDLENKNKNYYELQHLADIVISMLHKALDAFARLEIDEVNRITEEDNTVNREYISIIRQLISQMMEDPRNIKRTMDVLWSARALERIGDHVCNVCEHVVYIVTAEDVRHNNDAVLQKKVKP